MIKQLYFDTNELERGNFFELDSEICTEEGHRYELDEWVGRGGNAAVFKVKRAVDGRDYAVKFLLKRGGNSKKRFSREIEIFKMMRGEHFTKYFGSGSVTAKHKRRSHDDELSFIIMELAECNLREAMQEDAPINHERYIAQFRGLAKALASLHEHAVHRDIKPENILISGERWLLSDYGLCTYVSPGGEDLTPEGEGIGPKFWLSPEAYNRRLGCPYEVNKASDVFQLAAIFWYVVTERHPTGIVTEDDWTGPVELFPVLYKSLFHDNTKRPQNGHAFLHDLEEALEKVLE